MSSASTTLTPAGSDSQQASELPAGSLRRVQTPTVLQMEVTECGAASLAMILAFYGRWVPLEELRERCGASRDGTTAADLMRAAEQYGLAGEGYFCSRAGLAEFGFPLLLVWRNSHFVVLEGLDRRYAYLNDPAWGQRRVPLDEFDREYSKICLAFRPTAEFQRGGRRPASVAPFVQRGRPVVGEVLAVVVVGLLATIPGLAVAAIAGFFVDDVLVGGQFGRAWQLVGALAAVGALQFVMSRFQQRRLASIGTRLVVAESARFVHKALRLPERYFVARSVADLGQRVGHNREFVGLLTGSLASVCVSLIVIVVYGVAMFVVDALLAALVVALTLLNVVAMRSALNRQRNLSRLLVQERAALGQTTVYGAMTIETLKAGGLEGDFYARWEGTAVRAAEVRQRMTVLGVTAGSVPAVINSLVGAAILGLGAWRVIDGELGLGSLIAFQSLAGSFGRPFGELASFGHQLQHAQNLIRRLDDVLEEPVDDACDPAVQQQVYQGGPVRLDGALTMKGVRFGFKPTAPPLIDGFDLEIHPGQRVAVVGRSGSGKSTLVRLAAGLYEPWDGRILFDGRRRYEIPRPVLANSVAMVDQRIALFAGTVRDNLTLWDDTIPDDDVVRAARDAQIHDDIVSRAGGYSAPVADGGSNWSGGQRQRLEIARALVRNPSVLLLDEATSALDAETEALVEDALRRRGCTTLIVAHRLSTVRDADLIIVLDKGEVVERGRHAELVALGGHYARLVQE